METILLRTSERSTFMRCPQRWEWSYNQHLKSHYKAPPLRFGSLVHEALAAFYVASTPKAALRRGPLPSKTFEKLYKAEVEELGKMNVRTEPDGWEDALELGLEMLKNYVKLYGKDVRYRIIAPEMPFQVDIFDPTTNEYVCTYVGTLDACVEDLQKKEIGLLEHKTARSITTGHLALDEQAGSYWAFAPDYLRSLGVLTPKQNLDFILYNFLRKGVEDDRPRDADGHCLNQNGSISKNQPPPLFHRERVYRSDADRRSLMLRVIDQSRVMSLMRDGALPIYKSPMNGCVGMFSCEFRDMCEVHETGSDWEAIRDSMFETWEPYEIHEERESEDA